MANKRVHEDIFLEKLQTDLGDFKQIALDFCDAEVKRDIDDRLPPHFHVATKKTFKGSPANASILSALEYYSPALSAFACFKAAKKLGGGDDWSTLFDAGVHYHFEWLERKKSVEAYTKMKRTGKADVDVQYKVIEAYLKDKNITGYAIDKASIADKKTSENLLKQLRIYI